MKLKKNKKIGKNKGFTLVEVIVAVAILGLISVAAMTLMTTGARTFSSINYYVSLQYESQLSMSQIQEYVIDCEDNISFDDTTDTLTIDGTDIFFLRDDILYYEFDGEEAILAKFVSEFHVSFNEFNDEGTSRAKEINITLNFTRQGKSHEAIQSVALRNNPEILA